MNGVFLNPKRDYSVRRFHPWIFSGAVRNVKGDPAAGETVEVFDAAGERLGYGSYSPASQIRVRMLSYDPSQAPDAAFVRRLVRASVNRRVASLDAAAGRGVRLVHGESDGLPGVVADCYDGWCVVQLASVGAEFWKDAIVEELMALGAKGVWNRSDVDSRRREGLPEATGPLAGDEPPESIEIAEGALRFLVDVRRGHKTGFYLDQREARAQVGALAAGRDCLNCFSYTGGFGLACVAGGAGSVVNLDLSRSALDLARENYARSFGRAPEDAGATPFECRCADVFKELRAFRDARRDFDLIVLDPPKFADTRAQLPKAARGYKDINLLAMKLLRPGGVLATFSCSGAMTTDFFDKVVSEAAFDARRAFQITGRTRQAADHPVALSFPEGLYLKGLLLRAL